MAASLLLVILALLVLAVLAVVLVAVVVAVTRQGRARREAHQLAPALPPAPLSETTVAEISGLLARDKKIQAIKVLREATGLGLKEAKDRVDRWSDVMELHALGQSTAVGGPSAGPSVGPDVGPAVGSAVAGAERLAVEASAVLATGGWHTAEAFLREQRGLTHEEAKALLDSLA